MSCRPQITQFATREEGTIAILWAAALVMVMGFAAMAFDLGRVADTQSELQAFADGVALAAAGELDGNADAIPRAQAAAAALVSGEQTFGSGSRTLSGVADYTLTFHSALPSSDLAAMGSATNDSKLAKFARVTITPRSVSMHFLTAVTALTGGSSSLISPLLSAEAVAGFTQEACDITPLMFCVPDPGSFDADAQKGQMIKLRAGGNSAAWGPGDFGFVDLDKFGDLGGTCVGETGANLTRCLIAAAENATKCLAVKANIDTEPGQKNGIENYAFNARFDIFSNGSKFDGDARFVPAPNVLKGITPSTAACKWNSVQPTTDTLALPRDTCFGSGTCGGGNRYGDGAFSLNQYLDMNYGNKDGVLDAGEGSVLYTAGISAGLPAEFKDGKTRYEVYLREILYAQSAGTILTGRQETGLPSCHADAATPAGPERRVVVAAGVNCSANPINGKETDVPVLEYVRVFLTEPVAQDGSSPPKVDIWGEVIGSAGKSGYSSAGPGGIFRDLVQLYR